MSEQRPNRLQRFLSRPLAKRLTWFSLIGIALTVFGSVFIEIAAQRGMNPSQANIWQALISVITNFVLNYFLTWGDRAIRFRHSAGRYVLAKVVTVSVNVVVFDLAKILFNAFFGDSLLLLPDYQFAYIASTGFIMVVNYTLMDNFVFGQGTWKQDAKNLISRALFFWK